VLGGTPGVDEVSRLRLRWVGHDLLGEATIVVDENLTLAQAHSIAQEAEHRLVHAIPRLQRVLVHTDPNGDGHDPLVHHPGTRT
jgi:divalent metal cation (Fe/Co/Zn/Cd) transporter